MAKGCEDWKRQVTLVGTDADGNAVVILVDTEGRLTIPMQGENPDGDL